MIIGTVVGTIWATRKEEHLTGLKFLIVKPDLLINESSNPQPPIIAVDRIGAGKGDRVMVTQGSSASNIYEDKKVPIDSLIIGIIDSVDVESDEDGR